MKSHTWSACNGQGRGRLLFAVLLLPAFWFVAGCSMKSVESAKELAKAKHFYHKGDHPSARDHFKAAIDRDPGNDEAHYYLGMLLFQQLKEVGEAETRLRRAIELKPDNPDYAYQLAVLLIEKGGESEAETLLRKTISLRSTHAEAHFRLGTLLEKREHFDDAIRMYTRAIELKPRFATPYIALARLYEQYEFLPQALQVLENAAGNCPADPESHAEYGRLLAQEGEIGLAIMNYQRALELKPDYPSVLFNLGMAYMANQDIDQAVTQLKRYLARTKRKEDPYRVDSAEVTLLLLEEQLTPPEKTAP